MRTTSDLHRYAGAHARTRAVLATLLGHPGLEALVSYPSAAAVYEALLRTPYGVGLTGTNPDTPRLERRLVAVGNTLLGLLADPERAFVRLYLLHHEVDNLKLVIRAIHNRRGFDGIAPLLCELGAIATIDPRALAEAHDLRELAQRLTNTPYGEALRAALHRLDEAGPFALEVAVELDYYDRLWSAIDTLATSDAAPARRLLGTLFDILNLNWIAGYRDVLGLSPEEILNYTLRHGRWITAPLRRGLAEDGSRSWEGPLARTPYASLLAAAAADGFDAVAAGLWRLLAHEVQRTLSGYPFHIGVLLGCLLAQEIEIRDLQVLLAAKRLGLPNTEVLDHVASVRH